MNSELKRLILNFDIASYEGATDIQSFVFYTTYGKEVIRFEDFKTLKAKLENSEAIKDSIINSINEGE